MNLLVVLCLVALSGVRASATPNGALRPNLTLLTEVCRLNRAVSGEEVAGWKRQLHEGRIKAREAARLHLWLGEVEIARNREPERAQWHFREAQRLTGRKDRIHGCAAYDQALTLFCQGAYNAAVPAFRALISPKTALRGYDFALCALWYRHALACAGYHARHAELGITEPPSLDPLCGVASLAACLQAQGRACDRKTLLANCRMTGLGNNLQDLLDGAKRMGLSARAVRADDEGLIALPKPLVAYVELDHFVAVTRANREGVSYLCSDCGAWPGGRRDLTWKQWHAMDCNLYLAVTKPGSAEDNALRVLRPAEGSPQWATVTNNTRLAAYGRPINAITQRLGMHVTLYSSSLRIFSCTPPSSPHCTSNANCACSSPGSAPGSSGQSGNSTGGDPVNLATLEEEYRPEPDIVVYNPIGPSVVWQRSYGSIRSYYQVASGMFPYAEHAFGYGWNTPYDMQVIVSSNGTQASLYMPNGATYVFNTPVAPTASSPQIACPSATAGTPMLCSWNYNNDGSTSFVFTQPDRTQWVFSSLNGYNLTQIVDRNGNYITLSYTTPGAPGYELTGISDSSGRPLLTIKHSANFYVTSVTDRYGRAVRYQDKTYSFTLSSETQPVNEVTQVVRLGAQIPPVTTTYSYSLLNYMENDWLPLLHTITVPAASGRGVSTATINYNYVFVSSIVDANGNTTAYATAGNNLTRVTVTDRFGSVAYSYTVGFDAQMRTLSRTDGTNQTLTYQASYLPDNAYQPATVADGNNNTTSYSYDAFGQVASVTTPRNVTTTYTRDYSVFPLGELKQIQQGSKSPITISYYEPSGLIQTISTPMPGISGSTQTATTRFTYDALGNVLTVTRPGNGTTSAITTTLNYTQDGAYSQPDAIGQPLTVTDNLGHVTHMRYNAQGNEVTLIDALGNRTDTLYNPYNQKIKVFAPAVGDVSNSLGVTRSSLVYNAATKTYNGTLTLTNTGSQPLQGNLLLAFTNLAPKVTLANATGNYVNSPTLLSPPLNLAAGTSTSLNVSFKAPSAKAVNYGVQTYLTDASGNPLALRPATQYVYLYVGGPLVAVDTFDESGAPMRQVKYLYGKEGELLAVTGSMEPVSYTYDGAYRIKTLADGNGHSTQYAYNPAGWLASVTYPMGDSVQYPLYDPMAHVLKRIDGRGIETDYTYNDPESKLTNVAYVNNANYPNVSQYNVSIDYDGYGRTQDVYDFSGHTHLDYDDLDTQTEIDTTYTTANGGTLPTVALTYGFNPDGSRQSMNVQVGSNAYDFSYGYDAAGRPQSLINPFSETTQWTYLNNNWLTSQQYANGVVCQYAYNRRGFLNDLTHYAPNNSLLSDFGAMVYDAVGNRLTKSVTIPGAPASYSGQTAYAYDVKDQLTQEQSTLTGGYNNVFSYDPAGNPFSFKGQSHTFNADNQFTDTGFAYDGEGNPTTYNGTALNFDPEDHMTSFGTALTAGYRADGLRSWKQSANGTTYFLYDGIMPVVEIDVSGNVTAVNTFGANGLLSRHSASGSVFYTFDPQGSVSQCLDATSNLLSDNSYDAFGTGIGTANASDPFGYGARWGYETDQKTSPLLLGFRYYGFGIGRFVNRDPVEYAGGINLYSYVTNDSTDFVDPDGYGSEPSGPSPAQVPSNNDICNSVEFTGRCVSPPPAASIDTPTVVFPYGTLPLKVTNPNEHRFKLPPRGTVIDGTAAPTVDCLGIRG